MRIKKLQWQQFKKRYDIETKKDEIVDERCLDDFCKFYFTY